MELEIKEVIAFFIVVVGFLNFLFGEMKFWRKTLILILAGSVSWIILSDSFIKSSKEKPNLPVDFMKTVNLFTNLEFVKQKLGEPNEIKDTYADGNEINLIWHLDGLDLTIQKRNGYKNSIGYELTNDKVFIDIYSPKGNKLYDNPLGKITLTNLDNGNALMWSGLIYEQHTENFGTELFYTPFRWESYELEGEQTEYISTFEFPNIFCKKEAELEHLKNHKIRNIKFHLINGEVFHNKGIEMTEEFKEFDTPKTIYIEECK